MSYSKRLVVLVFVFGALLFPKILIAEGRPLEFGGSSFPPFFGENMENDGPLIEIARHAFAVSDREFSITWLPWKRVIVMARRGDIDGIAYAWYKPEREAFLYFGEPIFPNQNGLFKNVSNPLTELSDMSQLKGSLIGVVGGYAVPEKLLHSGASIVQGLQDINLLKMLALKRLDYVYTDKIVGRYLLQTEAPDMRQKVAWFTLLKEFPNHLAVAQKIKNADPTLILNQWSKGLKMIKKSGQYDSILRRYGLIKNKSAQ